jgi:muramoyltetrapeptide carboxypeptidase LdcA involved in peptidoglycan recycling
VTNKSFIYPEALKNNSKIGISGPSGGVHERFIERYNLAINHLEKLGYEIVEGSCLKGEFKHVSGSKHKRAEDFRFMSIFVEKITSELEFKNNSMTFNHVLLL